VAGAAAMPKNRLRSAIAAALVSYVRIRTVSGLTCWRELRTRRAGVPTGA
jgi:hypothetical protein